MASFRKEIEVIEAKLISGMTLSHNEKAKLTRWEYFNRVNTTSRKNVSLASAIPLQENSIYISPPRTN